MNPWFLKLNGMKFMWLGENVHLIGGLLALLCLVGAFRSGRRRWLIENLPTSKASDVSEGLVEVKGTAECDGPPLCSELTNRACIYFKWVVEEKWSRFTNAKFERETGWDKVAGGERMIPFRLKDESGSVLIEPQGAKIEPVVILDRVCRKNDPLYYGKGPAKAVSHSKHERRFYEIGIPVHQQLYVVGKARTGRDAAVAKIGADSQVPMFLISAWTEAEVRKRFQGKTIKWVLGGLAILVGGLFVRDIQALQVINESWPGYVVMIVGYILAAVAVFVWVPMPKAGRWISG